MKLPDKFLILMNDVEFYELVKFDSFIIFSKPLEISNHPLYRDGMKTFFFFNNISKSFSRRVVISAMMDPDEYEILSYIDVIRELKLEKLLGVSDMMDPDEYKILNYIDIIRELKLEKLLGED